MARRTQHASPAGVVIVALLAIALVVYVIKTLLITVAILAVPFGIWWLWDRERNAPARRAEQDRQRWNAMLAAGHSPTPLIDTEHEARMAEINDMPESAAWWRAQPEPWAPGDLVESYYYRCAKDEAGPDGDDAATRARAQAAKAADREAVQYWTRRRGASR